MLLVDSVVKFASLNSNTESILVTMTNPYMEVRKSPIHRYGGFALKKLRKGTRIIEYQGERISPKEADERYANAGPKSIVVLFNVDKKTTIDAGVNGNDARFINHSCDPNCEAVDDKGRIYIEATRTIQKGEELFYDYNLTRSKDDAPDVDKLYLCRCGAANCRGSMLEPRPEPKTRKAGKRKK